MISSQYNTRLTHSQKHRQTRGGIYYIICVANFIGYLKIKKQEVRVLMTFKVIQGIPAIPSKTYLYM